MALIIFGLLFVTSINITIIGLYIIARLAGTKHKSFLAWYKAMKF